jgi:hypothetical protein
MVRMFAFEPQDYRETFEAKDWIHIQNGITGDFREILDDFVTRFFVEHRVEGAAIGGRKEQALYEFPDEVDFPGELFDTIAGVCRLRRSSMTLSERHIKAYDADAPPEPAAHKDRFASQISMGVSISVPSGSSLVLYPFEHRDVNRFNISAAFPASLDPHERPEVIMKEARSVEIYDSDGDVVIFPGSSMWHLRRNAANVTNLYLKFNDFNSDPLAEDPLTHERRARTLEYLAGEDRIKETLVPVLGRRVDTFTRRYTRNWDEMLEANVWDQDPVRLSEEEMRMLQAIDGERSMEALTAQLGRDGVDGKAVSARIRRLADRGVLDLVASDDSKARS